MRDIPSAMMATGRNLSTNNGVPRPFIRRITMTSPGVQFRVGDFQCIAIQDGTYLYPTNWAFANVPTEQLKAQEIPLDHLVLPYTCLVVKTGNKTVLIDTGAGIAVNENLEKDGLEPASGHLLKHLSAEGIAREEITTVVLTHAHPDHIGGVLDNSGNVAFPNAQYVISKTEWDFWTSSPSLNNPALDDKSKEHLITTAQRTLLPLKGRIELLDGEKEIVSGVHGIPAPGHTPGHIAVVVSSSDAQLLHFADSAMDPKHLENPAWRNAFDLDHDGAATTKRRLSDRAAADNANVLAYHFPFPSVGRVTKSGNAWKFEAMKA
jgi:glyoxylase-like metal-dependent hydrolase (beta-lactamase superfamily II)